MLLGKWAGSALKCSQSSSYIYIYICVQLMAGYGCREWMAAQGSLDMGRKVAIMFEMRPL